MLAASFPFTRFLSSAQAEELFIRLPSLGISGGAVYDALVGAAAVEHGVPLLTRDQRALRTYRALDVEVVLID